MITVQHLSFAYGQRLALNDVSIDIPFGAVSALVGPNGAGKTTLMRCIAGLDVPLQGTVVVNGLDVIEHPRQAHQLIGYLSDSFGLYNDLTVQQCLQYAALAQGLDPSLVPQAITQTAAQLQLTDRLDQAAGTLSRGLRQRTAIGQAIIHRPKLLILDEPASGLDPEARASLSDLFKSLNAQGMTLLVSSHILAELDEYSNHVVMLREGKVIRAGALHSAHGVTASQVEGAQPSGAQSAFASTPLIELRLAVPDARLEVVLQAQPGLRIVQVEPDKIRFESNATAQERASLLASLITQGFVVSDFGVVHENLQQTYLRQLRQMDQAANAPIAQNISTGGQA